MGLFLTSLVSCAVVVVAVSCWSSLYRSRKKNVSGCHVLITGGSSGIGLALAKLYVQDGAHVTIIARNFEKLEQSRTFLDSRKKLESQRITVYSSDTTDFQKIQATIAKARTDVGPIDLLFCTAGQSIPGYFLEQDVSIFEKQMHLNYFGTLYTLKSALPEMVKRRDGHVVIVTSALAVVGFTGYSAYAPTKWALRGLADTIRNELSATNVRISIAYPPDTDTPGFHVENTLKPKETFEISPPSIFSPDAVATCIRRGVDAGHYHILSLDLIQNCLIRAMSGVSPRSNLLLDTLLAPVSHVAMALFSFNADRIVHKHRKSKAAASPAAS